MWQMTYRGTIRLQIIGTASYVLLVIAILFFNYRHDPFCHRPEDRSFAYPLLIATLMIVGWDAFGRAIGAVSRALLGVTSLGDRSAKWIGSLTTTLVVGVGLMSVPFWIYKGYGGFRLQNTVADVSCMFTEGYMYLFGLVVAPSLTLATLLREVVMQIASPRFGNPADFLPGNRCPRGVQTP